MGHQHGSEADHFASRQAVARLEDEERASEGPVREAVAALAAAAEGRPVARVLDLGCGPGGAVAPLAAAFPAAVIVAADRSPAMLERVAARAAAAGLGARVRTHAVDLDGDLGALGRCDLVWAAMSLHHARDPVATLRAVRGLCPPGALVCLTERAGHAHGHPGGHHHEVGPQTLAAAGLTLVLDRLLHPPPAPPGVEHPPDGAPRRLLIGAAPG